MEKKLTLKNPEIQKSLVMSTSHITPEDWHFLTRHAKDASLEPWLITDRLSCGWRIYIERHPEMAPKNIPTISKEFNELIKAARSLGCDWLVIDADAMEYEEFPVFE